MTSSVAQPEADTAPSCPPPAPPWRPVLRPLADILPATPPPGIELPAQEPASLHPVDPLAPAMAERVLRAAVEIMDGRRPVRQLAPVLRPELLTYLAGLRTVAGHLGPRLHVVRSQQPAPWVLEAVAVVALRTGVRALAARFEARMDERGAQWRCTKLHLPLTRGDTAARRR
ncbi:MAG: Rv3235 family protein [Pseudonocardiaceae bacterium]